MHCASNVSSLYITGHSLENQLCLFYTILILRINKITHWEKFSLDSHVQIYDLREQVNVWKKMKTVFKRPWAKCITRLLLWDPFFFTVYIPLSLQNKINAFEKSFEERQRGFIRLRCGHHRSNSDNLFLL